MISAIWLFSAYGETQNMYINMEVETLFMLRSDHSGS